MGLCNAGKEIVTRAPVCDRGENDGVGLESVGGSRLLNTSIVANEKKERIAIKITAIIEIRSFLSFHTNISIINKTIAVNPTE